MSISDPRSRPCPLSTSASELVKILGWRCVAIRNQIEKKTFLNKQIGFSKGRADQAAFNTQIRTANNTQTLQNRMPQSLRWSSHFLPSSAVFFPFVLLPTTSSRFKANFSNLNHNTRQVVPRARWTIFQYLVSTFVESIIFQIFFSTIAIML